MAALDAARRALDRHRRHRTPDAATSCAGVALGLALSTNQLAWFITPFLLVAYLPRASTRRSGRGRAHGWSPAGAPRRRASSPPSTLRSCLEPGRLAGGGGGAADPARDPLRPGPDRLTLFMRLGGGRLDLFNDAGGAALPRPADPLRGAVPPPRPGLDRCCPTAALFVSGRSLAGYWMVLGIPLLVAWPAPQLAACGAAGAAAACAPGSARCRRWRWPVLRARRWQLSSSP